MLTMSEPGLNEHTVDRILGHMNGEHAEDNLLIVRAFAARDAVGARMTGVSSSEGRWLAETPMEELAVSIPWSSPVRSSEDARREIIALQARALRELGQSG